MARASKLFGKTSTATTSPRTGIKISATYRKATKLNKEGFPAFERSIEEDTMCVLMTNTLSNTFYVSEQELAKETVDVLTKMAEKDPEFLAKALVFARNQGLMRLAPIVGLVVLSAFDKSEKKTAFRKVFHHVVKTPDDLREFVAICRSKAVRQGLGGEARDATKRWLQHMTEYHAVKYGSANSEGITLRDIIRMAHPRPVNDKQRELFGWVVKGWNDIGSEPSPTNPQVWAFEKLKRTENEAEIVSLIEKYRLTWEVVVPSVKKMTPAIWRALLKDMPYMALLRNLNTLERHGVFKSDAKTVVNEVATRLADPEQVRRSKQLPFRFFNAFKSFTGNQAVRDALVEALEQSFVSVPELAGRVCIANDISGSMGSRVSDKGETRYCDIAGLLGAALFKKCDDVVLLPFDSSVYQINVSRKSTIMDIAEKVGLAKGGTDLSAPVNELLYSKNKVDVFIGITDNMDWAGEGFLTAWERYKKLVNPNAKAFLIRIDPYNGEYVAPEGYQDVHFIFGWNDSVLKYISMALQKGISQVEDIRKMDLNKLDIKKEVVAE
jgi:60 kDa SS-A/Ro ribonucleoprotein